ncbi:response regulator [Hoyosella subflava]|uniref:Transcriptional regulatory protein n=1 Tax=Hoyosella subflava (strain DSM 45089 / JCM 17490 / NBRC 109087 / DQS3-9A1) TaxID=443218 RepID=F6ENI2_HOYSD|nr:response regulator [Hoyosella subflava]AEF41651.1 Two-component system response regulator [Hoyosella subflava DQS3-9A1]
MIKTLIVEDDARIADAHAQYVGRVSGFTVAGVVSSGARAWEFLGAHDVDLILLDFYLPDMTGLDVCRGIRARGHLVDIIAITSARDVQIVRSVVAYGVVHYLLKPFTFAAFKAKLESYREFRDQLTQSGTDTAQQDVDRALGALRGGHSAPPPKGMSETTLTAVVDALRMHPETGISASDLADELGMARVTTRRYLEHLVEQGVADRAPRYGSQGRPEMIFRWRRR